LLLCDGVTRWPLFVALFACNNHPRSGPPVPLDASLDAEIDASPGSTWVHRFGGACNESVADVTVATGDVVIIAGTLDASGPCDLGGGTVTSNGANDAFIAAYSRDGDYQWARQIGGADDDHGLLALADAGGDLFVVGSFGQTVDFGGQVVTAGPQEVALYLAKYTADNRLAWVQAFNVAGSFTAIGANGIALTPSGSIVLAITYQGTIDFGGGPLSSPSAPAGALVALSSDGTLSWSHQIPVPPSAQIQGVAVLPDGHVVVAGQLGGVFDFGTGPYSPIGLTDCIVARFSSSGSLVDVAQIGGSVTDTACTSVITSDASIVLGGRFRGTLDFGQGPRTSGAASFSSFVVQSTAGTTVWATTFGDPNASSSVDKLAIDATGSIVATGVLGGQADFGNGPVAGQIYVAKYSSSGGLSWARTVAGSGVVLPRIAVDSFGFVIGEETFTGSATLGPDTRTTTGGSDVLLERLAP
jgi:hypothetical protein